MAKKIHNKNENGIAVTWNSKKGKFDLKWDDPLAEYKGENKFKKTSRDWKGSKKPTKQEQAEQIRIYTAELEEKVSKLKKEVEKLQFGKGDEDMILAWEWFANIPDSELCHHADATERARQKRRRVANAYSYWLRMNYPDMYLHEVRDDQTKEFFQWRAHHPDVRGQVQVYRYSESPYKWESLNGDRKILDRFWEKIRKNFRKMGSTLNIINPIEDYEVVNTVGRTIEKYDPLTAQQMKSLYSYIDTAKGYTKGDYKLQLKALVYFHLVTGWRTEQVCTLEWKDIDLKNRLISITHNKTKQQGIKTTLHISDIMLDILMTLKEKFSNHKLNLFPNLVFGLRKHSGGESAAVVQMKKAFNAWREKEGLHKNMKTEGMRNICATSVESIRCGTQQQLSIAHFNSQSIDYLVGHSNGTMTQSNYLKLENEAKEATKELITHMEKIIGATFWNESARIESEKNRIKKELNKKRKSLKVGQGGFMLDIDPVTGKQIKIDL